MIQFREITVQEAMNMIADDDLKNLYFESSKNKVSCVTDYQVNFTSLNKNKYFKKEEIK